MWSLRCQAGLLREIWSLGERSGLETQPGHPQAQMWMGKKREWTGLTKEEWVMALVGFSAKQMQKKLSPRGSWMEIKESRVWQYRSSTDHRKPEGAHWIWLLVRNES